MDGACSTHGTDKYKTLFGEPGAERSLQIRKRRWEDKIRTSFTE
jgi:hypothetical protein